MKIVHISTSEGDGDPALAAGRLHAGLRRQGHQSTRLVLERSPLNPMSGVLALRPEQVPAAADPVLETILTKAFTELRAVADDRPFAHDVLTRDLTHLPCIREADVIHLHGVTGMLSTRAIRLLQKLGKPVVWSLYDQSGFTGGCRFAGDCEGYVSGCRACPRLQAPARLLPAAVLESKRRSLDLRRLALVCSSRWMERAVRRSWLFGHGTVHVIPPGIDLAVYRRLSRDEARRRLALPQDAVVVLVGTDWRDDSEAGHHDLLEVLARLAESGAVIDRLAERKLLFVGIGDGHLTGGRVPIIPLGDLPGDAQRAAAFRAADLVAICPRRCDVPAPVLEAVAAGTPVVAYGTGAVPELIGHDERGRLVACGDIEAMAAAIEHLLADAPARTQMKLHCERFAAARLNVADQVDAHIALYGQLLLDAAPDDSRLPSDRVLSDSAGDDTDALRTVVRDALAAALALGPAVEHGAADVASLRERVADLERSLAERDQRLAILESAARDTELEILRRALPDAIRTAREAKQQLRALSERAVETGVRVVPAGGRAPVSDG